jgi:hypothetical protein
MGFETPGDAATIKDGIDIGKSSRIGTWAVEERRDPISGEPLFLAQSANSDASGTWLQIRCESSDGALKPLLIIGVGGDGASGFHVAL